MGVLFCLHGMLFLFLDYFCLISLYKQNYEMERQRDIDISNGNINMRQLNHDCEMSQKKINESLMFLL